MGLEYSVTLRNEKELAAWEQSLQAQRKSETQLQKNTDAAKKSTDQTVKLSRETERFAKYIQSLGTGPMEKIAAAQARVNDLVRAGRVSSEVAERGMEQYRRKILDAQSATLKLGSNASSVGRSGSDALGTMAASLGPYLIGLLSVQRAVGAVVEGHQKWLDVSRELKGVNLSMAAAQENALKNLAGLPSGEKNALLTRDVPRIQEATGFPDQAKLTIGLGSAYSASGDKAASLKAVEAAARITRHNPDQLELYSGAALDIMRASGQQDAESSLGFMLKAGAISRVKDPDKLATNLPKVIAAAANNSNTDDDAEAAKLAASLFGVFSREAADPQGEQSRTASIQFLGQVKDFFEKHKKFDTPDKSPLSRIQALQDNAQLRRTFLKNAHGEVAFKAAFENVLTPGTQAAKDLSGQIPGLKFDRKEYDQLERELRVGTPQLALSTREAGGKARQQGQDTSGAAIKIADAQAIWDNAVKAMEKTDHDFFSQQATKWTVRTRSMNDYMFGGNPVDSARDMIKNRLEYRRQQEKVFRQQGRKEQADQWAADVRRLEKELQAIDENSKPIDLTIPSDRVPGKPLGEKPSGNFDINDDLSGYKKPKADPVEGKDYVLRTRLLWQKNDAPGEDGQLSRSWGRVRYSTRTGDVIGDHRGDPVALAQQGSYIRLAGDQVGLLQQAVKLLDEIKQRTGIVERQEPVVIRLPPPAANGAGRE